MSGDEGAPDRRSFLKALLAAPVAWAAGATLPALHELVLAEAVLARSSASAKRSQPAPPTPDCDDDDEPTPAETEGPFFKPRSPRRGSLLEAGVRGTPIVLAGRVYSRLCRPIGGALLDFWHADDAGDYDNAGYRCRGHQFADGEGRYRLETIVPGLYPGRTRHFHVKVQAPHGRVLTTQLYFPGEPRNRSDGLFRSDLLMALRGGSKPRRATFHFVLDA